MKTNAWLLVVGLFLVTAFVAASGVAVHYRAQARHFQKEYVKATLDRPEVVVAAAARGASTPAEPSGPVREQEIQALDGEIDTHARIAELERQLSDRDEMIAAMRLARRVGALTPSGDEAESAPRPRGDWLEDLRESDPERYAEIQQRRAEMRQRVQDSFARKAAHFLYRDVDTLGELEREEYERMLGLLSETWSLADRLQSDDLSREERWDARRTLMSHVSTLQPMLEAERDREFYDLGRQLGYDDQAAGQFVEYINDMIEVTSFSSIWRGQGRGMGAGGPGGR